MYQYLIDFLILVGLVSATWVWTRSRTQRHRNIQGLPLPPGPKGLPLIGNALQMPGPGTKAWLTFSELRKKYGDVVYAEAFGRPVVFLNSYKAAFDLLEKRSSIYSDRPSFPMISDLMGWQWLLPLMPYGELHRKHRLALHRVFQPTAVEDYADIQIRETHCLLYDLLVSPENFMQHIRRSAGAIIMMITYGHQVAPEGDMFITLADEAIDSLTKAGVPGTYFVDFLPWLRYVPDWFPGTGFKRIAKEGYALSQSMLHTPYDMTKENIRRGTAFPSMMSKMLEANTDEDGHIRDEDIIAGCTAVSYAGGADTTVSTLQSLVLALVLYPEVQKHAQEELDRVVGRERLPTFKDRASLPYIEAIVRESLRWNPVLPLGVAHRATVDDVYNGYFIPAGSTVLANQWAMLNDEEEYPNPSTFLPERWLSDDGTVNERLLHPGKTAFGFGRRVCPGRHLAENSIFIGAASIIATFNVSHTVDQDGNPVHPIVSYCPGSLTRPDPFVCSIIPRSEKAVVLIRQAVEHGG